jgi:hypothetical protein
VRVHRHRPRRRRQGGLARRRRRLRGMTSRRHGHAWELRKTGCMMR